MTRIQSFILAPIVISVFVSTLFIVDVVRQKPEIPPQVPNVSYEDIMLKKKEAQFFRPFLRSV